LFLPQGIVGLVRKLRAEPKASALPAAPAHKPGKLRDASPEVRAELAPNPMTDPIPQPEGGKA